MILGKLALNESQIMTFGISVFGTSQSPSDIRFVIEGDKFDIVCRCIQEGEDLKVDIPALKGILEAKEYSTRLEVIIGDKIFVPMKESIEFNPLIEFGVEKKEIKSHSVQVEIKANATSTEVKKSPLQENIEKASEKYEVKIVNGFNVLMLEGKYAGFVSETGIVESDKTFDTMSDLVDHLYE